MSVFDLDLLWRTYEMAQAERELRDPQIGGMMRGGDFLELCRRAGYPEEQAQKAATRREYLRQSHDMEK